LISEGGRITSFIPGFDRLIGLLFDPRSGKLPTEMGCVIDRSVLARNISAAFDSRLLVTAYRVRATGTGQLYLD
jgi:hypothetical protein